eukprot:15328053-Ditylum_brightwellii.AAC.1
MLQVDQDNGQFDELNEDDNINTINKDDCNSNCIIQDTLNNLPLMQEKFAFEKTEALKLFVKAPTVLVQCVNYNVHTWEPLKVVLQN